MYGFNLTNVGILLVIASVLAGPAPAQVNASEAAVVREHVNKGNYQMARGAWEQALAEYEAALDVDPGSMVAKENLVLVHNNWGIALFRQRKYEEAKAQWEEALDMNPYDRNAKQNLLVLKTTLARINAAPKPPVKPPEEKKDPPPADPKAANAPENPKEDPPSSGIKLLNAPKKTAVDVKPPEESSSGAVVIMKSGTRPTETAPDVPAPPAVQPTAPEPPSAPPSPATPTIDMNSPYSFVDTPTPTKPGTEVSSPYVMPTNLPPANRPKPYVAPPAAPVKPSSEWTAPASLTPEPVATYTQTESTDNSANSANLEDQLGAVEMKLSGRKQKSMPILKRIEKLETSISGQTKSGTLQERIEALRKSCGL